MAKIYWLSGQTETRKTVLANMLTDFLSTEKRNWRSKVFHIDDTFDITSNYPDKEINITTIQILAEYIYKSGCDVVVSFSSTDRELIEKFKNRIGDGIEEFYIYNSKKKINEDYILPFSNFFKVDIARDNTMQSFSKIIHYLREK
jgi:adenylylsulfate kinase-like enzyme